MRRWTPGSISGVSRLISARFLSTVSSGPPNVERISVRTGSAGSVSVDLHNIGKASASDPLLIYLPPYSSVPAVAVPQVPAFLRRYPTAVINYRWTGFDPFGDVEPTHAPVQPEPGESGTAHPQIWPVPSHDTAMAYSWIVENLMPPAYTRRDVYIYGSYLGASLATSLSLTECHPHQRMAVRGCIAYNGIYNWTMFLPDHQINKHSGTKAANVLETILGQPTDPTFQELRMHMPDLFGDPSYLFDPFASPCLFFQTPGLLVPQEFDASADPVISMLGSTALTTEARDAVKSLLQMMADKPPRRSPLAFPPRKSTLKIPETLLLHTEQPPFPMTFQKRRRRAAPSNHFKTQAQELTALMRRSLEKLELMDRSKWDEDFDGYLEVDRRVQCYDVGKDCELFELPNYGETVALEWLEARMVR